MTVKPLYRFITNGEATVSPNKPDAEYTEKVRIIADEGKTVTNDGKRLYSVIDASSSEGWYEVDDPLNA